MSWRRKEPGHQQSGYWPTFPGISRPQHQRTFLSNFVFYNVLPVCIELCYSSGVDTFGYSNEHLILVLCQEDLSCHLTSRLYIFENLLMIRYTTDCADEITLFNMTDTITHCLVARREWKRETFSDCLQVSTTSLHVSKHGLHLGYLKI